MKTRSRPKKRCIQTRKSPQKRHQHGGVQFKPTTREELQTAIIKYMSQEDHNYGHIRTWDVTLITDFSKLFIMVWNFGNNMFEGIQDWDVSNVTNMAGMFAKCDKFNQPLNAWDVSRVVNMASMFYKCFAFNQPLDAWNVSRVENMGSMFSGCSVFNQPLNAWNVSRVKNMENMFYFCRPFNQPLNAWDVSHVTNMSEMFVHCRSFNQPLDTWNVSRVKNMKSMFNICLVFNQPLNAWDVSHVKNMEYLFSGCLAFNQPLDTWYVMRVEDMGSMFSGCSAFNQPLNTWNVTSVENMGSMFENCSVFNQPLDTWNVSRVENMSSMFSGCLAFNQPLNTWDIHPEAEFEEMFENCPILEENKPARIRAPAPMQGIAYQVHNEFNTINKPELLSLLSDVATRDFSTMNNPNFVNYVKLRLHTAIKNRFTANERQPLLTALNALYTNLQMTETSQIMTAEYRNLYGKALDFMLEQPPDVAKEYLHAYVQECAMAYGANVDVTQMDPNNMSCVKGRFERLVMCMKTALLVQCVENPDAPTCLAIYKMILKKGFGVNISDSASAVVALDKNELIQQWNSEHLENEEYKAANHVGDMTEEQRRDFFRNDFIQFMRSAYEQNESLTAAIQSMIEQEANQLDSADVFRNMMFGGRGRGRGHRRRKHKTHKRERNNRRYKRNLSQKRRRPRM